MSLMIFCTPLNTKLEAQSASDKQVEAVYAINAETGEIDDRVLVRDDKVYHLVLHKDFKKTVSKLSELKEVKKKLELRDQQIDEYKELVDLKQAKINWLEVSIRDERKFYSKALEKCVGVDENKRFIENPAFTFLSGQALCAASFGFWSWSNTKRSQ